MRIHWIAALALIPLGAMAQAGDFTEDFDLEACRFSHVGANPYFSIHPHDRLLLEGEDEGEEVAVEITVLPDLEPVTFETEDGTTLTVRTRVVQEREWVDGELVEISRNYFARCAQTNAIYYFGEEVDIFEDGMIVSHEGAWRAGVDGARPGLLMPGTFLLGSRYFQEVAPGVALDRAEHVAMNLSLDTPAGTFDDCVEVLETTPLEPDEESTKRYCPGVGLVFDDGIELVEYERRAPEALGGGA